LVGDAYGSSTPFRARTALYRYQRDPMDIRRFVLEQAAWPGEARVLDIGCGPGFYLAKVMEIAPGSHAVGIDLSFGMAAEARTLAPTTVGDAQTLPFASDTFDVVIAAHMLYHVPNVDSAVRELARVVALEGRVLIVLNGREHLREMRKLVGGALSDIVGTDYVVPARSHHRLTIESAGDVLSRGLDVIRCERLKRSIAVPEPGPVIAYVDSMRSFYEPLLHSDIRWNELMAKARARVEAEIAAEGSWNTTSDAGCFVCRAR
jgi:SAM-dependent methyltransferase